MNSCNPCPLCSRDAFCPYAFDWETYIGKKEVALMYAQQRERAGGPSAHLERENLAWAKNQLEAHIHGGIPPEEEDRFCETCGGRGHECVPENHSERYRA